MDNSIINFIYVCFFNTKKNAITMATLTNTDTPSTQPRTVTLTPVLDPLGISAERILLILLYNVCLHTVI